jgi:hypothetical protein
LPPPQDRRRIPAEHEHIKNLTPHPALTGEGGKGNVFYVQEQIRFDNVDISVDDGEKKHFSSASTDQEIFFFSKGKEGYLVKILLPPVADRADNFAWSKSWLAGLQIPID